MANPSPTLSMDDVVARSRVQDKGKASFQITRKSLRFGFTLDQDTGKTAFYLMAPSLPNSEFEGKQLFFTPYSWRQFWQRLNDYPISGVQTKKIPETLIRDIAKHRMNAVRDIALTVKVFKDQEYRQTQGKEGKLFLRGYVSHFRTDYPTTALLQAMKVTPHGADLSCRTMPKFPDHIFVGRFNFPSQVEGEPELGCAICTSEVAAVPTTFNAVAGLPEHGVHIIAKRFGQATLKIDAQHKEIDKLVEDIQRAMKEITDKQQDLREHLKRSAGAIITKPDKTIMGFGGRHGLAQETIGAIRTEFTDGVRSKVIKPTKLGLAVCVAKVARRRKDPEFRLRLEGLAGNIVQRKV